MWPKRLVLLGVLAWGILLWTPVVMFAQGNTTKDVEIVAPGALFGPRVNQVDMRVSKVLPIGRMRLQANFDLFNIFNANAVLQQQNVFGTDGTTWQKPTLVLLARLVKLGFNLSF